MTLTYELLSTNRPPTQSEREEAEERLSKLNHEIDAFYEELNYLAYRWNRLNDQKEAVFKVAMAHYMVLSPFRTLPDDIIREICIACAVLDGHIMSPHHMPLLLTQISRRFRDVALTTPEVWRSAHIDLTKPRLHAELIPVARRWMTKYSGALPLSIWFRTERCQLEYQRHPQIMEEMMGILITCSSRWESINLSCSTEIVKRFAALRPMDLPLLRSLAIYFPDSDTSAFHSSQILTLPTLKTVSLMGFDSNVVHCPLIGARFTSLKLGPDFYRSQSNVSIQVIIQILQHCPLLVACSISVYYTSEDANLNFSSSHIGEVHLDFLKLLTINDNYNYNDHQSQSILRVIHAPWLECLQLPHATPEDEVITPFLSRSPKIRRLELSGDISQTSLVAWLAHCPQLTRLHIGSLYAQSDQSNQLFSSLVAEDTRERVCPELDHLTIGGSTRITTFECLNKFLSYRDGSVPGSKKWRCLDLNIYLDDPEADKIETEALISRVREAGEDIKISIDYYYPSPPESVASN